MSSNMASFPNIWTHRKVAETASKPCEICYKPSASVLITPENKVNSIIPFVKLIAQQFLSGLFLCMPITFEG